MFDQRNPLYIRWCWCCLFVLEFHWFYASFLWPFFDRYCTMLFFTNHVSSVSMLIYIPNSLYIKIIIGKIRSFIWRDCNTDLEQRLFSRVFLVCRQFRSRSECEEATIENTLRLLKGSQDKYVSLFRIRDILLRIRILRSVHLLYRSGSCSFRQWLPTV